MDNPMTTVNILWEPYLEGYHFDKTMVPFISEIVNNIVLQIIDKVEELDNCSTSMQMANLKIL